VRPAVNPIERLGERREDPRRRPRGEQQPDRQHIRPMLAGELAREPFEHRRALRRHDLLDGVDQKPKRPRAADVAGERKDHEQQRESDRKKKYASRAASPVNPCLSPLRAEAGSASTARGMSRRNRMERAKTTK
jgi:hypothetical protein